MRRDLIALALMLICGFTSCENDLPLVEVTQQVEMRRDSLHMDRITTFGYDLQELGIATRAYSRSLENYDLSRAIHCYTPASNFSFDAFISNEEGLDNCLFVMKYNSEPCCIIYQRKEGKNAAGDECFTWYNQANEPLIRYAYNRERNEYYGDTIYIDNPALMTRASARGLFCNLSMWGVGTIYSAAITAAMGGVAGVILGGAWVVGSYFLCDKAEPKNNQKLEGSMEAALEDDSIGGYYYEESIFNPIL